jgi:hypothetical protein
MFLINTTPQTIHFVYNDTSIVLEPNEFIPINAFDLKSLDDIQPLIDNGFLTFYDDEDLQDDVDYELTANTEKSYKIIADHGGKFKNINFNKDLD